MSHPRSSPWLHGLAWLTAVLALLPISVGAVVTTVDAGMAFADWPTSHGQGMFEFPWLKSRGDEFLEHGHRLAGMLVGFATLILAAVTFSTDTTRSERWVVGGILLGVIAQGMLGGWRVVADERVIAMLHGNFAAIVFALMAVLVVMTQRRWGTDPKLPETKSARGGLISGGLLLAVLTAQYFLGSLLRHLGNSFAWLVHPWFAIAVVVAAIAFLWQLRRTGLPQLRRSGYWVLGFIAAQALLGVVTWGMRYGFPQFDIVAVQHSSLQVAVRSLHKVFGLVTYMTTVVALARLWHATPSRPAMVSASPHSNLMTGGVA